MCVRSCVHVCEHVCMPHLGVRVAPGALESYPGVCVCVCVC